MYFCEMDQENIAQLRCIIVVNVNIMRFIAFDRQINVMEKDGQVVKVD